MRRCCSRSKAGRGSQKKGSQKKPKGINAKATATDKAATAAAKPATKPVATRAAAAYEVRPVGTDTMWLGLSVACTTVSMYCKETGFMYLFVCLAFDLVLVCELRSRRTPTPCPLVPCVYAFASPAPPPLNAHTSLHLARP